MAASGAALGVYLLGVLEPILGVKLYAPPLAAASIIIFINIKPPSATNVFAGTIGAAALAIVLHSVGGSSQEMRAVAVAVSMIWFKASGALFPPAAAAAAVFYDSTALQDSGWQYLLFPCLSGTGVLYGLASVLSRLRQSVRVAITRSQLDFGAQSLETMRTLFETYDTSGDGRIDADELKVMLRALVGADLALEDCEQLIRQTDVNGDGVIDFDEFVMLMQYDPSLSGEAAKLV